MTLHITGSYIVTLFDLDGNIVKQLTGTNMVVNAGRDLLLSQVVGLTSTPVGYVALGSSTTPVTATQSTLIAEAGGGVRVVPVLTPQTPGSMVFAATWTAGQNQNTTVNEVGFFTASSGGIMLSRFVLPSPINKDQYSPLQVQYTLSLTAS